ncbi:MAG: hypothetical protein AAGL34_05065 [Bacteroidota bacterium]
MSQPKNIQNFLTSLETQNLDRYFETVTSLSSLTQPYDMGQEDSDGLYELSIKAYHNNKTEELAKTLPFLAKLKGHNEDFLGNMIAFAILLDDPNLMDTLKDIFPKPVKESGVLAFNIACLHAKEKNKKSMLQLVENAMDLGKTPNEFYADEAFNPYLNDSDFLELMEKGNEKVSANKALKFWSVKDSSYEMTEIPLTLGRVDAGTIPWLFGIPWPKQEGLVVKAEVDNDYGGTFLPDVFLTGCQLASPKVMKVFEKLAVDNIDVYDAVLNMPDKSQVEDYKAFYIKGSVSCMHQGDSEFNKLRPGRTSVHNLVLDSNKIPDLLLFRLAEDPLNLIMADSLKQALDKAGVTGLYYLELEVG